MRGVWRCFAAVVLMVLSVSLAQAEKRVALVIGNSNYRAVAHLPNPANDASAFAKMLKTAGFDSVTLRTDVGIEAFRQSLRDFTTQAADADMAVFYYAGHGIELDGNNLLIPVDAKLRTDLDAEDETVPIDRVMRALKQTRKLRLLIIDACRDNPFATTMKNTGSSRGVSRGFQRMEDKQPGTLIAFATDPGSVADDGNGSHSPFTQALLANLAVPGLDLRIALGKVHDDVMTATGGRQQPYVNSSLGGAVQALVPGNAPAEPSRSRPPGPDPASAEGQAAASDFRFADGIGSVAGWEMFLRVHPDGPLADVARDRLAALKKPPPDGDPPPPAHDQQARIDPQVEKPSPVIQEPSRDLSQPAYPFVVGNLDPNGDNFLALRMRPNPLAPLIRRLGPGTGLRVDVRRGPWIRVTTADGEAGWVAGTYVLPRQGNNPDARPPPPVVQRYSFVTGLDPNGDNFLALKAGPNIRAARIMKMGPGTKLRVLGRVGDWVHVQLASGLNGWAAAGYIGCCTNGP